ncbi:MAG: sugar ABC transporter permease [Thermomicrobiales bacterium]|nr:sugar ABC transporter permease [Thermomicrobiales bacterium]
MATATTAVVTADAESTTRPRRRSAERWLSPLMLTPSLIAILIFVYGFIGMTVWVSLSNWGTPKMDLSLDDPLLRSYDRLFSDRRFQSDLRNTLIFTVLFLFFAVGAGLTLAVLLDRNVFGKAIFRNIFLFPYALSFITTGVAWRWIFNPETGVNLLFEQSGLNTALDKVGVGPLKPGWLTDPRVVWQVNDGLEKIFPWADAITAKLGIPLALFPVAIAAAWQLSGFAMAMYLAGMGTIPNEVREAAQLDGASTFQLYRHIIIPLLTPITVSTMIILGHVSLKIFDLVYAMSGKGPGFATDVPGIYVFDKTFSATQYNLGAAASIVMLVLVCTVIVPYLVRTLREL